MFDSIADGCCCWLDVVVDDDVIDVGEGGDCCCWSGDFFIDGGVFFGFGFFTVVCFVCFSEDFIGVVV